MKKIRMDDVIVKAEVENLNYPQTKYIAIWFTKVRVFLKLESGSLKCRPHGSDIAIKNYATETVREHCFVQYYGFLQRESFAIDRIDKYVNFVRLQSDREERVTDKLSVSKAFGLIHVHSIRERVHIVSPGVAAKMMGAHVFRTK